MKDLLSLLILEACAIVCAVFAGLLAYAGKDGWGWFLGMALLTTVSSYGSKK
jgi:hypothetical protein